MATSIPTAIATITKTGVNLLPTGGQTIGSRISATKAL